MNKYWKCPECYKEREFKEGDNIKICHTCQCKMVMEKDED